MIKEIKYLIFSLLICIFFFLTGKFYFSETNEKKNYRSLKNLSLRLENYENKIPFLKTDTNNIIEYTKNSEIKKKKFNFWKLLENDEK